MGVRLQFLMLFTILVWLIPLDLPGHFPAGEDRHRDYRRQSSWPDTLVPWHSLRSATSR